SVPDAAAAQRLFDKLRAEVVLVTETARNVVTHRADLRAVMLESLKRADPVRVEQIHQGAVAYYERHASDPESRGEEIYHRLSLATFDRTAVERRWVAGLTPFLAHAMAELPPRAQGFVAARLNLALEPAVWA